MPLFELGPRVKRRELHAATQKEKERPQAGSPVEQFFDLHFELLATPQPRDLRVRLLGKAVASGVQARESRAVRIINDAAEIAETAHEGTTRGLSEDPYVVHPYRAAFLGVQLAENMGIPLTTELIVGALLHDTIEDHPEIDHAFLLNKFKKYGYDFAERVAGDAEALSKFTDGKKLGPKEYADKIRSAPTSATLLRRLIIKSADRIDNLIDPPTPPARENGVADFTRKRRKIIDKTQEDLLPLLQMQTPDMPIATDHLLTVVTQATQLSESTLDTANFDPHDWRAHMAA